MYIPIIHLQRQRQDIRWTSQRTHTLDMSKKQSCWFGHKIQNGSVPNFSSKQ